MTDDFDRLDRAVPSMTLRETTETLAKSNVNRSVRVCVTAAHMTASWGQQMIDDKSFQIASTPFPICSFFIGGTSSQEKNDRHQDGKRSSLTYESTCT